MNATENVNSSIPSTKPLQNFTYLQWLMVTSCLLSIILNATLLCLYYRTRNSLTPFSIYIINLLISNLMSAVFQQNPFLASKAFFPPKLWPQLCVFVRFVSTATAPLIPLSHMIIALNRVWALAWPLAYRTRHTTKVAVVACLFTWIVAELYAVPMIIIDINVYCTANSLSPFINQWRPLSNWLLYDVPEFVILVSYPYFIVKQQRKKVAAATYNKQQTRPVSSLTEGSNKSSLGRSNRPESSRLSNPFVLLTLMTFSILVCWTPMNVYFMATPYLDDPNFLQVCRILKIVHAIVDPIIFGATVPELKSQLLNAHHCLAKRVKHGA